MSRECNLIRPPSRGNQKKQGALQIVSQVFDILRGAWCNDRPLSHAGAARIKRVERYDFRGSRDGLYRREMHLKRYITC